MSELKEYKITTTLVCIVEAENKEQAQEEFDNLSDYGYVDDCNIEELSDNDDFDIDVLEKFFDEFDYWGTLGWLQAIMNGGIDLDVLRECVRKHSEDTLGSYLPDNLFIKKDKEGGVL